MYPKYAPVVLVTVSLSTTLMSIKQFFALPVLSVTPTPGASAAVGLASPVPITPAGPAAPVGPVGPIVPGAPSCPGAPAAPGGPAGPVGPVGPMRPVLAPPQVPSALMTGTLFTMIEWGVMSPRTLSATNA